MHTNTKTLADLMAMLHELSPRRLIKCRDNHTASLKQLRLVSKEICGLAQNAVLDCSVQLGEGGPSPSPEQLIRLMAGAQLQKLAVTITVTTGVGAPTLDQQQSFCSQQMDCLLAGLGKAMESVTYLTLDVVYPEGAPAAIVTARADADLEAAMQKQQQWKNRLQKKQEARQLSHDHLQIEESERIKHETISPDLDEFDDEYHYSDLYNFHHPQPTVRTCPEALGQMAGRIFERLAVAVPNLQRLDVCGSCWDAGLGMFGTHCPRLSTLDLDIRHVPIQALNCLGSNLPNLKCLSLGSYGIVEDEEALLGTYMDAAFNRAKDCLKLTDLDIDITECVTLICKSESWVLLPASLQHLRCSCFVEKSDGYTTLLRRLPCLTLQYSPFHGFLETLQHFPLLQSLAVLGGEGVTLDCADDDYSSGHSLLKERLISKTFELSGFSMSFTGTCKQVRDMFAWLPEFPDIGSVIVEFADMDPVVHCLERIPVLFPSMQFITFAGQVDYAGATSMDMSFFTPLATCTQLENLSLERTNLPVTTAGLVQLCSGLSNLKTLDVKPSMGVDMVILVAEVKKLARKVPIYIVQT